MEDSSSDDSRPRRKRSWEERPTWFRHSFYWALALVAVALSAIDTTTAAAHDDASGAFGFVVFLGLFAFVSRRAYRGLVSMLREWEQVSVARTVSRSLVVFTCLLGFMTLMLFQLRRWGVHIEACRVVAQVETCGGQASPRQVLDMLAWHAANAVPVLDITNTLEWFRPARSANPVVGASILLLRLWVAIGILAVLKRLWDKWGPGESSPAVSDLTPC